VQELETMLNEYSAKGAKNVLSYAIGRPTPGALDGNEIIQAAMIMEQISHRSDVRYVWLPPIAGGSDLKQVIQHGPRTSGDVSVSVDPDGTVYAPRGPLTPAGNLANESFPEIWSKEIFRRYRERIQSPTHCEICPGLDVCGADCPAAPEGWEQQTGGNA
jgi:radical SAM protein with 4Fe4S-binding SPASM domain